MQLSHVPVVDHCSFVNRDGRARRHDQLRGGRGRLASRLQALRHERCRVAAFTVLITA